MQCSPKNIELFGDSWCFGGVSVDGYAASETNFSVEGTKTGAVLLDDARMESLMSARMSG